MGKRKAISTKARFDIFKRDGFICQYCGAHPPMAVLHVDHITPVAGGGGNESSNLVTSCDKCNLGKGARSLSAVPQSLQSRAEEIKDREAQLRGYSKIMEKSRARREKDVWRVAQVLMDAFGYDNEYPTKRLQTIRIFVDKLGVFEVLDSADTAVTKPFHDDRCFKYFCGICWRKMQDQAS